MTESVIGSIEHIHVVAHGDVPILSKIDTGAESSSIWATKIEQDKGALRFAFFGPGSVYYTGDIHTVRKFKVTSVKNSFGHSEVRFKILLKVKIGNRTLKGWFTLADRSRNSYPILIGKSLLKGEFLVDVARNHVHGDGGLKQRVLVVSASEKTKEFLEKVEERSSSAVEYASIRFEDVLFVINGEASDAISAVNGESLAHYSLTYVKSHWNYPEPASALAELLRFKNRPLIDEELLSYTSRSKLSEMMKLSIYGLPVPRSYVGYREALRHQSAMICESLTFPFIMKSVAADKGRDNFFVDSEEVYKSLLDRMSDTDIYAVQEYVPSEGFYRVNVFGKDATLAVYRSEHAGDDPLKRHLNKPSGGANATLVSLDALPEGVLELAVRAAICMNRQIAGADIIQHRATGEWYVLEVNNAPQIRSGAYVEEKINEFVRFIEERLTK